MPRRLLPIAPPSPTPAVIGPFTYLENVLGRLLAPLRPWRHRRYHLWAFSRALLSHRRLCSYEVFPLTIGIAFAFVAIIMAVRRANLGA